MVGEIAVSENTIVSTKAASKIINEIMQDSEMTEKKLEIRK